MGYYMQSTPKTIKKKKLLQSWKLGKLTHRNWNLKYIVNEDLALPRQLSGKKYSLGKWKACMWFTYWRTGKQFCTAGLSARKKEARYEAKMVCPGHFTETFVFRAKWLGILDNNRSWVWKDNEKVLWMGAMRRVKSEVITMITVTSDEMISTSSLKCNPQDTISKCSISLTPWAHILSN